VFQLPEDFDREWPLHRVVIPSDDGLTSVDIGPVRILGWHLSEDGEEIVLQESTYKHYKFYTSGERIDQIQMLAHHAKASMKFGVDEDGDVFWEVRFKVSDFKEVVRE